MMVDSSPSENKTSFLALQPFSVLRVTIPLTISPGLYSVFPRLISKVKSVPFSILLNIISYSLCEGLLSKNNLNFTHYFIINAVNRSSRKIRGKPCHYQPLSQQLEIKKLNKGSYLF